MDIRCPLGGKVEGQEKGGWVYWLACLPSLSKCRLHLLPLHYVIFTPFSHLVLKFLFPLCCLDYLKPALGYQIHRLRNMEESLLNSPAADHA